MSNETENGVVYLLTSPSGKQYVGQTWEFEKRMRVYRASKSKKQRAIHNAIAKYGWGNFTAVKIVQGIQTQEWLNKIETAYIKAFNTIAPNGYNLKSGGDGGGKQHAETKAKLKALNLGKKQPPRSAEWCANLSASLTGHDVSDETRKKISASCTGRITTTETRKKMSLSRLGKPAWNRGIPHSVETRKKMRASHLGKKRGPYRKRRNANQISFSI